MSTRLLLAASALLLASPAVAGNGNANGNGNGNANHVLICHVTGNGSVIELSVSPNALPAFLAQGDTLATEWFEDLDGDGYGDSPAVLACEAPAGYVDNNDDCDDADASVNPGALEICGDGIDNDCDGLIDEDCGPCDTAEWSFCTVNLATGAVSCDNGNPVSLVRVNQWGPVFEFDMSGWKAVVAEMDIDLPTNLNGQIALNIGNSPSNNGWSGDGSQFANDSEMQLYNNSVHVFRSDRGGNGFALGVGNATDLSGDNVEATVCDGYFAWESYTASADVYDPYIFQIDGNEPDGQAGGVNDQSLWFGVGQVVQWPFRRGTGIQSLNLTFWR